MQKRGQVTIFVILGIIIIVAIVFGITMKKQIAQTLRGSETAETLSFTEQAQEVKKYVEDCLKESLIDAKDAMLPLNMDPEDYNNQLQRGVKERTIACLNFRQFADVEITDNKDEMTVEISRNSKRTVITAIAKFDVLIKQGENAQRYSTFEVSLTNFAAVGEAA